METVNGIEVEKIFKAPRMYRLKAYEWESRTYPEFEKVKMQKCEAPAYLKKLSRHFKVSEPRLSHINKHSGGHYSPSAYGQASIALPKETSLSIVCHEFAHHLDTLRHPESKIWHGRTFKRELKKVYTFTKRYLPKV